jgi:DNA-binding MarR family transcriptional regulator
MDDNALKELLSRQGFNGRTYSQVSIKKSIDQLEKDGWIELVKHRPKIHAVSQRFIAYMTENHKLQ